MSWRMVKQPNGLYARFSDVVDDFTHRDLTRLAAHQICITEGCPPSEANAKVEGADRDDVRGKVEQTDGLNRWRDSLRKIEDVHGPLAAAIAEAPEPDES